MCNLGRFTRQFLAVNCQFSPVDACNFCLNNGRSVRGNITINTGKGVAEKGVAERPRRKLFNNYSKSLI